MLAQSYIHGYIVTYLQSQIQNSQTELLLK